MEKSKTNRLKAIRLGKIRGAMISDIARSLRPILKQPKEYRLIPLTRDFVAMVDIEDYEYANSYNWSYAVGYAKKSAKIGGKQINIRLHRKILERKLGYEIDEDTLVDHIDGNRLNCRRDNLRPATKQQNTWNRRKKNTSGYIGVRLLSNSQFSTTVAAHGTTVQVGCFDDIEEAAWMRDQWALALHGEFATLNFEYKALSNTQEDK